MLPERRESRIFIFHGEVKCKYRLIAELLHVFLVCQFQHYWETD